MHEFACLAGVHSHLLHAALAHHAHLIRWHSSPHIGFRHSASSDSVQHRAYSQETSFAADSSQQTAPKDPGYPSQTNLATAPLQDPCLPESHLLSCESMLLDCIPGSMPEWRGSYACIRLGSTNQLLSTVVGAELLRSSSAQCISKPITTRAVQSGWVGAGSLHVSAIYDTPSMVCRNKRPQSNHRSTT